MNSREQFEFFLSAIDDPALELLKPVLWQVWKASRVYIKLPEAYNAKPEGHDSYFNMMLKSEIVGAIGVGET